jgi:dual specificity MAP kinase phosphatase
MSMSGFGVGAAAVLVHCGAGVSRSAALAIAYLMRRFTWPAKRARAHCQQRRSLVSPNQGFWRSLCALEEQLGITER